MAEERAGKRVGAWEKLVCAERRGRNRARREERAGEADLPVSGRAGEEPEATPRPRGRVLPCRREKSLPPSREDQPPAGPRQVLWSSARLPSRLLWSAADLVRRCSGPPPPLVRRAEQVLIDSDSSARIFLLACGLFFRAGPDSSILYICFARCFAHFYFVSGIWTAICFLYTNLSSCQLFSV